MNTRDVLMELLGEVRQLREDITPIAREFRKREDKAREREFEEELAAMRRRVEADAARRLAGAATSGRRRGRLESHLLAVAETFCERDTVPVAEFVEAATGALPAPEEGKRDTRRQLVIRALDKLSREPDGPLCRRGGVVDLY